MSGRAIVEALEALGAGDTALMAEILLSAQEDGPQRRRKQSCPNCLADFDSPCLLEKHFIVSGHGEQEVAA